MGGGSTDAAVALQAGAMAIAEAGGPTLDDARLRILARTLGADVSFFLDPRPSIGRGIGEILEPLSLPEIPLVLIFPEEHLSTARVYRAFDANRSPESRESFVARADRAEMSWRDLAQAWDPVFTGDVIRAAAGMLRNDLEETSFSLVPELVFSKRALQEEGALGALMSGSGPTLFGVYPSAEAAAESAQKLAARGFRARAATVACGVTEGSWTAPDSVSLSS